MNHDGDYQMSLTCGQYGPHISPKNAYFSYVIGVYFVSLFIDHPVFAILLQK